MNNKDLKTILSALRSFVQGSRPAYKDYLGEETVETPSVVVCEGTMSGYEGPLTTANFRKFEGGETYLVTVGGETAEYKVQTTDAGNLLSNIVIGNTEQVVENGWLVVLYKGLYAYEVIGSYIGQTITVSTLPTSETQKLYDVRKLPEDCVPDSVTNGIAAAKKAANKAQSAADEAYDYAEYVDDVAYSALRAANTAQSTADAAKSTADAKMSRADPVGSGSFSMGRKQGTLIGTYSHAEGHDATASNYCSHAEGNSTTASGKCSHVEGGKTTASGECSHAEGYITTASGECSHAEGNSTTASGKCSHVEGANATASGDCSHAEGYNTAASGECSHVEGRYNIEDAEERYAHIVGNGVDDSDRSNAHTLSWNGVPWFQGRPQFGGTAQDDGSQTVMANGDTEIVLTSPNGTEYTITVDDEGVLHATPVVVEEAAE